MEIFCGILCIGLHYRISYYYHKFWGDRGDHIKDSRNNPFQAHTHLISYQKTAASNRMFKQQAIKQTATRTAHLHIIDMRIRDKYEELCRTQTF